MVTALWGLQDFFNKNNNNNNKQQQEKNQKGTPWKSGKGANYSCSQHIILTQYTFL